MGRKKYTAEERTRIIASFVRTAAHIIESDGLSGVSIRRVATEAGYNSATLYLYFKDLDELLTLACVSYLEGYCRELANTADQMQTPEETYFHTWKIFCKHAFSLPEVFYHLFFAEHSVEVNKTVDRYYRIYPSSLDSLDGVINNMLHEGELLERNLSVMAPLADGGIIDPADVPLVNELTVCYFGRILSKRCQQVREARDGSDESPADVGQRDADTVEELTNQFMDAAQFLFTR